MLFDLRGRGRRRTIQAIYLTLAILMGGGLVFFGIGSDATGGLFDALGIGGSGSGQRTANPLDRDQKRLVEKVRLNPNDAAAWATLARVRCQLAGQGENFDPQKRTFTAAGRKVLGQASTAWERHLALNPRPPDPGAARYMVQAYAPAALNQPDKGVRAAEVVATAQPTSQTYFQLAVYAYAAGQTRKGDLAGARAVQLAPADQRATVKAQVDQAKQQGGFPRE